MQAMLNLDENETADLAWVRSSHFCHNLPTDDDSLADHEVLYQLLRADCCRSSSSGSIEIR